jgi:hypothetical protein
MRDVYHKARPLLLTRSVWRARVLLWIAAGATGIAAIAFAWIYTPVLADDGAQGRVVDVYLDERDWQIRFLLANLH